MVSRRAAGHIAAAVAGLLALAACTSEEIKDGAYAGGKVIYDTLKNMNERDRPPH